MTATRATGTTLRRPSRLPAASRRDALLDAALDLVRSGGAEAASMEAVAARARVSRPLVYKHFANRDSLLTALYRRESTALHERLVADVRAARSLEGMFAALLRGSMTAASDRGHVFSTLRGAGAWTGEIRAEQHRRDRDTVRAFAAVAVRTYGLEREHATTVTAVLLAALDGVLAQWRRRPAPPTAALLEATYLAMVRAAYVGAASGVTPPV